MILKSVKQTKELLFLIQPMECNEGNEREPECQFFFFFSTKLKEWNWNYKDYSNFDSIPAYQMGPKSSKQIFMIISNM